jgi:hypothetical protein
LCKKMRLRALKSIQSFPSADWGLNRGWNFFSQNKSSRVSKEQSFWVEFKNINLP